MLLGRPALEKKGRDGKLIHVPLELCRVASGQTMGKKCSDQQTQQMIKFTTKKPNERKRLIEGMVQHRGFAGDPYLKAFDIEIGPTMENVQARVLPVPTMQVAGQMRSLTPRLGAWDFRKSSVVQCPPHKLERWSVISFSAATIQQLNGGFSQLARKIDQTGVPMSREPIYTIPNVNGDIVQECVKVVEESAKKAGKPLDMLFVVLDDTSAHRYQTIKFALNGKLGIPSQCLQKKWFQGKFPPTVQANIALKVNAKLGGTNYRVMGKPGDNGLLDQSVAKFRNVMVLGGDVSHPPKGGSEDVVSLASLVGSTDVHGGRFVARVEPNPVRAHMCGHVCWRCHAHLFNVCSALCLGPTPCTHPTV
jgi:eukaryotic translation initiation factor 2C